ncbi:hypothetical protein PYCCODRAFT_110665 [Trametes coccinea BRFM310]|uniref:Uncharacterized protein n=1 Tax=Trametes coccinea (strain BRFM310) TaxID=1353009 RepID=A0A1Y2IVC2_TRAC3|nr:hypothetical protein PYCCODRAFT_110665 [Trametes coccinea BRFM310]
MNLRAPHVLKKRRDETYPFVSTRGPQKASQAMARRRFETAPYPLTLDCHAYDVEVVQNGCCIREARYVRPRMYLSGVSDEILVSRSRITFIAAPAPRCASHRGVPVSSGRTGSLEEAEERERRARAHAKKANGREKLRSKSRAASWTQTWWRLDPLDPLSPHARMLQLQNLMTLHTRTGEWSNASLAKSRVENFSSSLLGTELKFVDARVHQAVIPNTALATAIRRIWRCVGVTYIFLPSSGRPQ